MRFDALTSQAIGEAVRLRRKALGNTLDDLAEASGISKRTLIKLEQGQDVRFSTLTTVLSWLGLSLDFSTASRKCLKRQSMTGSKMAEERRLRMMPSGSELQEIPRSPFSIGRRRGKISSAR